MQVFKITKEQKNLLIGQTWDGVTFFNPTIDADGQYFVSQEEVNGCDKPEFQWLKSCELIEYNPVITNYLF
jgi:hypothetical protein